MELISLLNDVRACTVCAEHLDAGPRPVLRMAEGARIVVVGQAPGRRVHESGIPWDDPSGVRLRGWMDVSDEVFYDESRIAIIPMGFCYPGTGNNGDLPPRPECAPLWHDRLFEHLPDDRLEIIIGAYAQKRYIADPGKNLTDTVGRFRDYLPRQVVLPHPSPRNIAWFKRNPWFEEEVVPALRARVTEMLS